MNIDTENMCNNEVRKAGLLLAHAADKLGMDCSGYGEIGVNSNSGNVYLWLEEYPFCLFIGLCTDDAIEACYTCPYDGEETIIDASNMGLDSLTAWAAGLAEESEAKED